MYLKGTIAGAGQCAGCLEVIVEGERAGALPEINGWMRFAGVKEQIAFDLKGNFHRDIRGAKIRFTAAAGTSS